MPETVPPTVQQPDWKPTRKHFWGTVVAMGSIGLQNAIGAFLPGMEWLQDPSIQGWPNVIVGGAVGYFVKDAPNQPQLAAQLLDAKIDTRVAERKVAVLEQTAAQRK